MKHEDNTKGLAAETAGCTWDLKRAWLPSNVNIMEEIAFCGKMKINIIHTLMEVGLAFWKT